MLSRTLASRAAMRRGAGGASPGLPLAPQSLIVGHFKVPLELEHVAKSGRAGSLHWRAMAGWLRAAPRGAWRRACCAPLGTQVSCLEGLQPSIALLFALQ